MGKISLTILIISVIALLFIACNQAIDKNASKDVAQMKDEKVKFVANERVLSKHSDSCGCSAQFEIKDSLKLVHIKNQFYKSSTGHLYERTVGLQEMNGHLIDHEYFNGYISQDIAPLTFETLKGWYAKDENHVYYYRPVSGGMQIEKLESADPKTFKLLEGHYKYGVDNNHFFDELQSINGFMPSEAKLKYDKKGRVIEMICNNRKFMFEIVELKD